VTPDDPLLAELEALRVALGAGRCTLRQPREDDFFPVSHEVLAAGAPAIADDRSVDLRTQPVPRRLAAGERQVVQEDCRAASDEPAFHAMLRRYGGMRAQVVTAIHDDSGELAGILSVHDLTAPRRWSPEELGRIDAAAAAIRERIL
jgi:GAF domain-containing protein